MVFGNGREPATGKVVALRIANEDHCPKLARGFDVSEYAIGKLALVEEVADEHDVGRDRRLGQQVLVCDFDYDLVYRSIEQNGGQGQMINVGGDDVPRAGFSSRRSR